MVDVSVKLITGQFHAVDSSDMAFKTAARQGMTEAMPKCDPVLLEPIHLVEISVPNAFTARVQRLISGRRGQILGYDAKPGWDGWDVVSAHLPRSELHDLIVELRSLTLGVGTYADKFDHLQELTGRLAEKVIQDRTAATPRSSAVVGRALIVGAALLLAAAGCACAGDGGNISPDNDYLGFWRVTEAEMAPWTRTRRHARAGEAPLLGWMIEFADGELKGPPALACKYARYLGAPTDFRICSTAGSIPTISRAGVASRLHGVPGQDRACPLRR